MRLHHMMYLILLGITPLAHSGFVLADNDEQRVRELLDELSSTEWSKRQTAGLRLADYPVPAATAGLLDALREETTLTPEQLRQRGLASAPGEQDYARVSQTLRHAYRCAVTNHGAKAIPLVRAALKGAPDAFDNQLWIILGANGEQDALEPLLHLLNGSTDPYVQASAASSLGRLGSPAAIPALRAALDNPFVEIRGDVRIPIVREAARAALHRLGITIPPREKPEARADPPQAQGIPDDVQLADGKMLASCAAVARFIIAWPTSAEIAARQVILTPDNNAVTSSVSWTLRMLQSRWIPVDLQDRLIALQSDIPHADYLTGKHTMCDTIRARYSISDYGIQLLHTSWGIFLLVAPPQSMLPAAPDDTQERTLFARRIIRDLLNEADAVLATTAERISTTDGITFAQPGHGVGIGGRWHRSARWYTDGRTVVFSFAKWEDSPYLPPVIPDWF